MLIRCSCKHDYQDKRYGVGVRVHNPLKATSGGLQWRCTVCETTRAHGEHVSIKVKKN